MVSIRLLFSPFFFEAAPWPDWKTTPCILRVKLTWKVKLFYKWLAIFILHWFHYLQIQRGTILTWEPICMCVCACAHVSAYVGICFCQLLVFWYQVYSMPLFCSPFCKVTDTRKLYFPGPRQLVSCWVWSLGYTSEMVGRRKE